MEKSLKLRRFIMQKLEVKSFKLIDKDFLKAWQKLWNHSSKAHFFNSPRWFLACKEAFQTDKYWIEACYEKSQLVAVCPVVLQKKYGVNVLTFPGRNFLGKSSLLMKKESKQIL